MKIVITSVLLSFCLTSFSQNHFCGQYQMEQKYLQQDGSINLKRAQLQKFTEEFTSSYFSRMHQNKIQSDTILYVIPVVFHIMHDYGAENISKAQVLDVMRIINEYFQKTNADTAQIIPAFQSIMGDAQVEFRLAQLDPQGNCTDGITRHQTYLTNGGNDLLKSIVQWAPDRYLNIWVENNSQDNFSAYAYFPGAPPAVDGIVIMDEYVGSIGSAQGNTAFSVLAHEIGHYLNLWHTWGPTNTPGLPTNCGFDDLVFDTPNCIGGVCNVNSIACNGVDTANVQNMMDYCSEQMFTQGQVVRMHAALNSSVSNRNNLWAQTNLQLTGTNDGYVPVLCAPVADFSNKTIRICEGDSITFINASYGGNYASTYWQFTGGNISASTDTNPTVTYNTAGVYNVTLTVGNASGTSTITQNNVVEVSPAIATTLVPIVQDFETLVFPSNYWSFENVTGTNWQTTSLASVSGTKSIHLQNDSTNIGTADVFYTESYNMSNITAPVFSFKVAFANRNGSSDNLKIFVSTNCGLTWVMKYSKTGNSLETVNDSSQNFIPLAVHWRQDAVNINNVAGQSNVRFKYQFTSQGGNNIFIDDINVNGVTGLDIHESFNNQISVYPTVVKSMFTVKQKTKTHSNVCIKDIAGRELKNFKMNTEMEIVSVENFTSGIYFIEVQTGKKRNVVKFFKAPNE